MFLNLLYKSLKADVALRRVKAFVKRLLQVSAEQNASFTCGALFLVSEVIKAKPGLKLLLQEEGQVSGSPGPLRLCFYFFSNTSLCCVHRGRGGGVQRPRRS